MKNNLKHGLRVNPLCQKCARNCKEPAHVQILQCYEYKPKITIHHKPLTLRKQEQKDNQGSAACHQRTNLVLK